ncbi:MAG TPA: pitrilysin family protein [Pyrinomonadaceae bacterium]|nr:pitrilysin family protein [Pyrinomonadaceae bacterium]
MKKIFVSSFLAVSLLTNLTFGQKPVSEPKRAVTSPAADTTVPIFTKTLANGLEVIVYQDSSVPLVTAEMDVRNGSFTEPPELNGLSHLYEHMFFKSNDAIVLRRCEMRMNDPRCLNAATLKARVGDASYLDKIGDLGLVYNGSTREEVVNYYYTTTSPYLEAAIHTLNDAIRFPVFDENELNDEKKVVIGEMDRQDANPYSDLARVLNEKLFYKYPTRKTPIGTRESVQNATTEKMRLIQSRYYVPNNSALVVTGDVKAEQVFALAEKIMGSWQRRPVDPFKDFPLVEHPPLEKSEGVILDKRSGDGEDQNIAINIGWQGPSIGKDNAATYAADVFSYILTQPDSRFQRNIVDAGLASGVGIGYYTQRNVGPINVVIQTTPDKAKAALKAVYGEIAQFASPNYFSDEELESSKTILAANDLYDREKASEYTHTLGFWWSSTGIDYFRGYQKNLNAVSRADITRYVNTYIIGKPHVGIALVAPAVKTRANITEADLVGAAAKAAGH